MYIYIICKIVNNHYWKHDGDIIEIKTIMLYYGIDIGHVQPLQIYTNLYKFISLLLMII